MNHLRFALLSSSVTFALAAFACGGISDPTRGGEGRVATVSGALTGIAVPANAHVALVYRKHTTTSTGSQDAVEVGSDVAVVGGKFTMNLGVPAADYFSSADGASISGGSSAPPTARADVPSSDQSGGGTPPSSGGTSGSGAFGASTKLAPRDLVGGSITEPLSAAVAGFVVYVDANGNGKLDLEGPYASSPDEILGGNAELMLVYLKGGGSLDYEKLRDKSGILPATGFNLMWSEGRWLPLNDVELKLTPTAKLPSGVCYSSYGYASGGSTGSGGTATPIPVSSEPSSSSSGSLPPSSGSSGTGNVYPAPGSPGLVCSSDGRSFQYYPPADCAPSPPPPVGLCAGDVYETSACASPGSWGETYVPGATLPAGWPCPTDALDGGAADAAVDAGSADGG